MAVTATQLAAMSIAQLSTDSPAAATLLMELGIEVNADDFHSVAELLEEWARQCGMAPDALLDRLEKRMMDMQNVGVTAETFSTLEIVAGADKEGTVEPVASVVLRPGDLVALVGPTGSGKSRLLADIEWFADADTPSGRTILLDGNRAGTFWARLWERMGDYLYDFPALMSAVGLKVTLCEDFGPGRDIRAVVGEKQRVR